MLRRLATALLATTCLAVFAADHPAALVAKLAPSAGWAASEPARVAAGDDLFDLIDGGAELYQEYGFVRAVSWQLENAARSTIQVEVYEMTDAPAAFGVWSLMQTGKFTRSELGHGSLRFGYYVAFWSGPYFASITGAQPDAATQAEVDRLAAQLAALLPRQANLLAWPFFKLGRPAPRKYFRGRIGLSNISVPAIVDLFEPGEGVVDEYADGVTVVLKFASETDAQSHFADGVGKVRASSALSALHDEAGKFSGMAEDGRRITVESRGSHVFVSNRPAVPRREGKETPRDQRRY